MKQQQEPLEHHSLAITAADGREKKNVFCVLKRVSTRQTHKLLLVLGKQAAEARQFLLVGNGDRGGGGGGGLPGPDSRALLLDLVEDWISFQELVLLHASQYPVRQPLLLFDPPTALSCLRYKHSPALCGCHAESHVQ